MARFVLNPKMHGNTEPTFVTFDSMPACIGACKRVTASIGADLLSDPQEDPRAWVIQTDNGAQHARLAVSPLPDQPAPALSTFWGNPQEDAFYLEIGALAFPRSKTAHGTLTAGIKFVRPLK